MNDAYRALADPTRRRILELLAQRDRTAGEIAEHFPMAFSSISHHLTVLKGASLVGATREGQNIRYHLNTTVFQEVVRHMMKLFRGGRDA